MRNKRLQKRWKRENRTNKGENTERARQEKNAAIRAHREQVMSSPEMAVMMAALAASRGRR